MVDNTGSVQPTGIQSDPEKAKVIALDHRSGQEKAVVNNVIFNKEQQRAFNIVHSHLKATLAGKKPPQLQMLMIGPGGTGKTVVINKITHMFAALGANDMLLKTTTSGVATTLISGTTLHYWAALPMIICQKDGWIENPVKR